MNNCSSNKLSLLPFFHVIFIYCSCSYQKWIAINFHFYGILSKITDVIEMKIRMKVPSCLKYIREFSICYLKEC